MSHDIGTAEVIFFFTLAATFLAALLARLHSVRKRDDGLAGRHLNRWLVGLSAGTTANSGFIVTAAVGLGYAYGLQWVLLPISWLLGDLVFWHFFPARINAFGVIGIPETWSSARLDTKLTSLLMKHGPNYFKGRFCSLGAEEALTRAA